MNKILALSLLLPIALLLCSCAKQGFPPGGPADRTPPEVVSTSPPCNSTGVSLDAQIEVGFSERMDRDSVKEAIYICPVLERPPELSWKGRRLFIKPLQRLSPDQTYVVTIGTGAQDQQGNPLARAYSFAFSTGSRMDLGRIGGSVISAAGPQPGAIVWAYRLERGQEPDPAKDAPRYVSAADREGNYLLSFLSLGTYRVFAFLDKDGDGRYTPEQEALAVPPGDVALTDSASFVQMADLFPVVRDTTRPQLLAVKASDQDHLELTFDEPVDISSAKIVIVGEDTLSTLAKYILPGEEAKVQLLTERQQPGEYNLVLDGISDLSGNPLAAAPSENFTFRGSPVADTIAPEVVAISPKNNARNVHLDQPIEITFSEAMGDSVSEEVLRLSGQSPAGKFLWRDPITLQFLPSEPWQSARRYCFGLFLPLLPDYAGNAPSDSLYSFCFNTVNKDTLGFVAGRLDTEVLGPEAEVYIRLKRTDWAVEYWFKASRDGRYLTGGVLPGAYFVWAFWDRNGNGKQDYGSPAPYQPAEPVTGSVGTVLVRSGWTTEKVDLKF